MELKYLKITAYKDNALNSEIGDYTVMLNPETYTQNYAVQYNIEQAPGTPNTTLRFEVSTPQELSFDLVFDGTGVVNYNRTDLLTEIESFKNVVYTYNGDIHSPNYLKLSWGEAMNFPCRLTSLAITYKLFKPDGTPLRAEAKVSFKEYQDPLVIEMEAKRNSPDMSHIITVVAGDTLPALAYKVYGENGHYLKVATFNQLDNFRKLKPGSKIQFPPLI